MSDLLSEQQAIQILLIRAIDESEPDLLSAATRSAAAVPAAEHEKDITFFLRRAASLYDRLPEERKIKRGLLLPKDWSGPILLVAFIAGVMSNYLGSSGQVHILYNPLTLLIVWNLLIYIVLLWHHFSKNRASVRKWRLRLDWIRTVWEKFAQVSGSRAVFWKSYLNAVAPFITMRVTCLLYTSAAGMIAGAIAGTYFRGLFAEYQAVWKSTFIHDPHLIASFLNILLGPASVILQGALVSLEDVEALLPPNGVSAGPWIHRLALTALLFGIVPRCVLLMRSVQRASHEADHIFIDFSDRYFTDIFTGMVKQRHRFSSNRPDSKCSRCGATRAAAEAWNARCRI